MKFSELLNLSSNYAMRRHGCEHFKPFTRRFVLFRLEEIIELREKKALSAINRRVFEEKVIYSFVDLVVRIIFEYLEISFLFAFLIRRDETASTNRFWMLQQRRLVKASVEEENHIAKQLQHSGH